jgi:hypothetical protein
MKLIEAIEKAEKDGACEDSLEELRSLLASGITNIQELKDHKLSPYWAYCFARDVIKGPWPEGEDTISKDAEWSYYYAKAVIKGPWPKGEDVISKEAEYSYYYAKDVIKGPFSKGVVK